MCRFARSSFQRGQSTIEVLLTVAILAVVVQSAVLVLRMASKSNVADRDRALATEKALQMLEELRARVSANQDAEVGVLDDYNDGNGPAPSFVPIYKYTLTTKREITHPQGVAAVDKDIARLQPSDNPVRNNGYVFVRNVVVERVPNDANARRVRVRVYKAAPNNGPNDPASTPLPEGGPSSRPLAEVMSIVHSLGSPDQPAQVYDYFLVALENVPGWWSRTSNLIPLMQSSLSSLQSRNPGLRIRAHWITRLSYGRDLEYTPEVNAGTVADTANLFKKTYLYPGYINYDSGPDDYYYTSWFRGRINLNNAIVQNEGYPMADQFNHPMRLPDEERLYAILSAIAANNGEPQPEISLRQLLERLNNNHPSVRNAVVVNLHGEMLPAPPLRNYSDAAKDPAWAMHRPTPRRWRAVSHFERLAYNSSVPGQNQQALNVYAYDMNPPADPISQADEDDVIPQITIFIPNASLNNLAGVERVRGNSRNPYKRHYFNAGVWSYGLDSSGNTVTYQDNTMTAGVSYSLSTTVMAPATWIAGNYTPPGREPGLRIILLGTTPTARVYNGPDYEYYFGW